MKFAITNKHLSYIGLPVRFVLGIAGLVLGTLWMTLVSMFIPKAIEDVPRIYRRVKSFVIYGIEPDDSCE